MAEWGRLWAKARTALGVVVPAVVLGVALGRVGLVPLVGATLALGVTFGVVYAYARFVNLDGEGGLRDESRQLSQLQRRRERDERGGQSTRDGYGRRRERDEWGD